MDDLYQNNGLSYVLQRLNEHKLAPSIGAEIEFYLTPNIDYRKMENALNISLTHEKGNNQFEINLPHSLDILSYPDLISKTINHIHIIANNLNGKADFRAKPFQNDYGNSIHFHFSFDNSDILYDIARSICYYMLQTFIIFAPNEEDYLRFDHKFMAPVNVSFGGNNRSVALRIPDSLPKRIEHRLSSPSIDPYLAIFTILNSILLGFQYPENRYKITKIFGNAFDEQYNLQAFPKSRQEALTLFNKDFFKINYET